MSQRLAFDLAASERHSSMPEQLDRALEKMGLFN